MIIDKYVADYWNRMWVWFRRGATFVLITILWIPFRADSLAQAVEIFRGLKITGGEYSGRILSNDASKSKFAYQGEWIADR